MFFTATDIASFVACRHLLTLKMDAAEGKIQKSYFHDLGVEVLRELGERHETAYFNQLASRPSCRVVSIPTDVFPPSLDRVGVSFTQKRSKPSVPMPCEGCSVWSIESLVWQKDLPTFGFEYRCQALVTIPSALVDEDFVIV